MGRTRIGLSSTVNARFVRRMKFPRSLGWLRGGAGFFASSIIALSVTAADAPPPPTGPAKKFAEKRTEPVPMPPPSQPVAQPLAQPVAQPTAQPAEMTISREAATKKTGSTRKVSPSLASLPAPKAASGPLRILLVDDDWSDNNGGDSTRRPSASDEIFSGLVAAAVGGDTASWSVEIAQTYKNGPAFERLRDFNVVLWYTGASYGGGADNIAVLSLEDEKTVRRYLQETGGSFILVSPGYVNNLSYGSMWTDSPHPFLKEVMGINGFAGMAQRFAAGQVQAHDGSSYSVGQKPVADTQFSAVNPNGAAIVFTSSLDPLKTAKEPVPVAVAHPFAGGRFVYVGFTFENIAEKERSKAFDLLLSAAVGSKGTAAPIAGPATPVIRTPVANFPGQTPGLGTPTVQVSGTAGLTVVRWSLPSAAVESASLILPEQIARSPKTAPAPGLSVKVERWTYYNTWGYEGYNWKPLDFSPGASEAVDPLAQPGSAQRYRVTVTDASGVSSFQEVQYNVPPVQEPPSLSATQQSDGTVILTWPEVPGVQKYQIQTVYPTWVRKDVGPLVVTRATEWRSAPLDGSRRTWSVTSLYETPDGKYASLSPQEKWPTARTEANPEYVLSNAQFWLSTGDDNKELLSHFEIQLYINGGERQQYGLIVGEKNMELKKNSSIAFSQNWSPSTQWSPAVGDLENIRRHGLRVVVKYFPNFILDAWELRGANLYLTFQKASQVGTDQYSEGMHLRAVMDRDFKKLLTERDNQIEFIIDGSVMPAAVP